MKETLRMHPPGTLLVPRQSMQNVQVQEHYVPAKTRVLINALAIGRYPKSWNAPDEFWPKRFMETTGKSSCVDFQLIPIRRRPENVPRNELCNYNYGTCTGKSYTLVRVGTSYGNWRGGRHGWSLWHNCWKEKPPSLDCLRALQVGLCDLFFSLQRARIERKLCWLGEIIGHGSVWLSACITKKLVCPWWSSFSTSNPSSNVMYENGLFKLYPSNSRFSRPIIRWFSYKRIICIVMCIHHVFYKF